MFFIFSYETTNSESLLLHGNISDEENLKIILMSDIEEKLVSIQGIMLPKSDAGGVFFFWFISEMLNN